MSKKREPKSELDRFKDAVASLGEQFKDYLLIARTSDGILLWRSSDKTWSIGAAGRYLKCADEQDARRRERAV